MSDRALRPVDVARETGVSTDTLRHYERRLLLPQPARTSSGHRRYSRSAIERVQLIQSALQLGFTLRELAAVLSERDRGGIPCARVVRIAESKVAAIDAEVERLLATRRGLTAAIRRWRKTLGQTPSENRAHLLESLVTPKASTRSRS